MNQSDRSISKNVLSNSLSRRELLTGGIAAVAGTWIGPTARAQLVRNDPTWPSRRLTRGTDAISVNPADFMPVSQMRAWYEELDDIGLRATGSPRHERYIDTCYERMGRVGIRDIQVESVPFRRWSPTTWSLDLLTGPDAGPVKVASYIPYSGVLPPEGIQAPLVYVPLGTTPVAGSLAGKVALFEITIPQTTLAAAASLGHASFGEADELAKTRPYARVYLGDTGRRLEAIRQGKPVAMLAILPLDDAAAAGMYLPYDGVIRETPGLFLARSSSARMKAAAAAGATVRVRLSASQDSFSSRNLIGIIPGRTDECVMLHCHTDGPNGIEDNGPDLILSIAQYLARIPRHDLPRSIAIVLTTGHFIGGAGSIHFVNRHREDLIARTVAAITIEHVGAQDLALLPDGSTHPTGLLEPALVFMPPGATTLEQYVTASLRSPAFGATFLAGPTNPHAKDMVRDSAWPGEGEYLWNNAGLPDANYITGPNYLFNADYKTAPLIDFSRLREQTIEFTNLTLSLLRSDRRELAVSPPG